MTAPGTGDSPVEGPAVAVVGGGQLARMMQQAAIGLGVPLRLLAEGPDVSAAQVVRDPLVGDFRDLDVLREVARGCAVMTFDHEHVPTAHLQALEDEGLACRPGPAALVHAQDKLVMRERLTALEVPCPRWRPVSDAAGLDAFAASVGGYPVIVKTPRGGYDGKGVWVVDAGAGLPAAGGTLLAEERVDFARELAVLVARSPSGQSAVYPVVESVQRRGVCREVTAPAPGLDPDLAVAAQQVALGIAGALDVTGLLAVEMFETSDGRVLVNELAMRPHNTGHWTIDGSLTSQFDNHLRAVLDLPLGATHARAPWTVMVNILGGEPGQEVGRLFDGYPHVFARDPGVRVHLYGKAVRPGRKVGHVTAFGPDLEQVRERARHAAGWFDGTAGEAEESA
ncbi:MAG TPA: 5-(carboxyamino)imidazole ribonucleotide synthase [Nocardioidaceae bacterium]|nr:5-(carboxyamino)imidazole ribonucleotide synthase [Nocardioidaceae bacterium]